MTTYEILCSLVSSLGMANATALAGEEQVHFLAKHPSLRDGIGFSLPAGSSVGDVRDQVHQKFPGRPEAASIVVSGGAAQCVCSWFWL